MTLTINAETKEWMVKGALLIGFSSLACNLLEGPVTEIGSLHSFAFGTIVGAIFILASDKFECIRRSQDKNLYAGFIAGPTAGFFASKTIKKLGLTDESITIHGTVILTASAMLVTIFGLAIAMEAKRYYDRMKLEYFKK